MLRLFLFLFLSTSIITKAQNCENFGFFKKGAEIEMTSFDSKGRMVSKGKSKVIDIVNVSEGKEAKVETKTYNEKGKEQFAGNANVVCAGNRVSFSMKNMVAGDQMAAMKNMEMKIDETMLDYPNNISIGSSLKDGSFKAEMYSGGMKLMTLNYNITNRKVIGEEDLATPAGNFKCYKITYSGQMKSVVSTSFDVTEWYSPKMGLVKTETSRNGKSMGYTIITQTNAN